MAPLPLFCWIALTTFLLLALGSPVQAQSASPEAGFHRAQPKKTRPGVAGKLSKPAIAKTKLRVRAADKVVQPASESAAPPASEASDKAPATPPVKTSETVDFDSDAEDVQKMEPGLELIQAAPRRARHRSLVPASPSPEDSVVNRP